MLRVVFVAPFLMRATIQFIEGVASLDHVQLILLSQERQTSLPPALHQRLHSYIQAASVMSEDLLLAELQAITARFGKIDRLLGTLEHLQVPLGRMRERLGITGMSGETAHHFRDKARMKEILRSNDLPCARHCLATTSQAALEFIAQVGLPVVIKPCDGAGSRNTYRLDSQTALETHLAKQPPEAVGPILIEEFIKGEEYTFDSAFINGTMVWHSIVRYFPNPLEALRNPWIQLCMLLPRELDHPYFDDIRLTACRAVRTLGMETGLSHLEWFRRADGSLAISEVGARPPGGQITSMHGLAHDVDIHRAWAQLMVFGEFPQMKRRFAAGTVFLRAMGQGRVKQLLGWDIIEDELGDMIVESRLPRKGQPTSGTYEGEGYIVIKHPVTRVVEKSLDLILAHARVVLE